jgi:hypothetical protein
MFPAASVAAHCTAVTPTGKKEPEAGVQEMFVTSEHESVAVGKANDTIAPHWPGSLFLEMLAGHVILGGVASITVTVLDPQGVDKP